MVLLVDEPKVPNDQLIDANGIRTDGRKVDELRKIRMECSVLKNAQGSALIEWGGNKIYAVVYGPREVHPRHLARPDRGILRIFYRMATYSVFDRKSPAPNRREVEISKVIREALEPVLFLETYPNSALEIFIEVVAADGGTRCASTTVASLALADAGIPMRDLVSGVAAGKAAGQVILDCNDKEDKEGEADMPAAIIGDSDKISLLQFDGQMSIDEMKTAFEYLRKGGKILYEMQREALKQKYLKIREQVNPPMDESASEEEDDEEASEEDIKALEDDEEDEVEDSEEESSEGGE